MSSNKKSDAKIIRDIIQEMATRDSQLNELVCGKNIVLQMKDADMDIWCDIEEDEEVSHMTNVNVIFVSKISVATPEVISLTEEYVESIAAISEEHSCIKVLYTEPLYVEDEESHNRNMNDTIDAKVS